VRRFLENLFTHCSEVVRSSLRLGRFLLSVAGGSCQLEIVPISCRRARADHDGRSSFLAEAARGAAVVRTGSL
jgi:hypothetical protein